MNDGLINELISNGNEIIAILQNILENSTYSQNISWLDILTIIVAFFAASSSIVGIFINKRANKELTELVQKEENNRTNALINANLTANARIEWIQNVRKVSTYLITSLKKYIDASTEEEASRVLMEIYENKTLLILYFGPDKESNSNIDLMNTKSNTGKNNLIVKKLDTIYTNIQSYHKANDIIKHFSAEIRECEKSFIYSWDDKLNAEVETYIPQCESDEYGTKVTPEECKACLEEKKQYPDKKIKEVEETKIAIKEIADIMRIYLKHEWDNVKENKE